MALHKLELHCENANTPCCLTFVGLALAFVSHSNTTKQHEDSLADDTSTNDRFTMHIDST